MDCNAVKNSIVPRTKFSRKDARPKANATQFKQVVDSLMYLTATIPDLMYGVSLVNRFMSNPTKTHSFATKTILRYLKGTTVIGFFTRKESMYEFVFSIGSGPVSWSSKK